MAISTYKIQLMDGGAASSEALSYKKLVDIKDFPDLGGAPELLETTTLSDNMQTYIPGIQSIDAMEFNCNYDMAEYQKLKALESEAHHYAVYFGGDTGTDGKFTFDGTLSVFPVGAGVNEVVDMRITIAPSTPIAFSAGA